MATSDNADKYDRQLRLWGANGQRALMKSKVLLINADAAGTETLKNLVLPGVGDFEILDNNNVTPVDISNNFFVTGDDLGKPRGEVAKELLVEMNPDVNGVFCLDSVDEVLKNDPQYFAAFSVIIASNVTPDVAIKLSGLSDTLQIPLVALQSLGFLATCRIQTKNHEIIESHPDNELVDLGLTTSFPDFEAHCGSMDLATLNSMDRSHVPYVVLLHLALTKWRQEHGGGIPGTFAEKETFKRDYVKTLGRPDDVNVEEAVREAYRAFVKTDISAVPEDVVALVEGQKEAALTRASSPFSWCVRALQHYMELHQPRAPNPTATAHRGTVSVFAAAEQEQEQEQEVVSALSLSEGLWSPRLRALIESRHVAAARSGCACALVPLSGFVPDMHSSTTSFIEIQRLFVARATGDKEVFALILQDVLRTQGGYLDGEASVVPAETIDAFCKHVFHLRSLDTSRLLDEFPGPEGRAAGLERLSSVCQEAQWDLFDDEAQTPLLWYLALRALERHFLKVGDYPPGGAASSDADVDAVWAELTELLAELAPADGTELALPVTRDHVKELLRLGVHNSQLHTVSSFIGGLASQEVIKLLTHQFIPMNNTFIYNGVCSCGAFYTL